MVDNAEKVIYIFHQWKQVYLCNGSAPNLIF